MSNPERIFVHPDASSPDKPMSGSLSALTRGVINLTIAGVAVGATERFAAGDTEGGVIWAAVDGAILVGDAIVAGVIARRNNELIQGDLVPGQEVAIPSQTPETPPFPSSNATDGNTS